LASPCADLLPRVPGPLVARQACPLCPRCGIGTLARVQVWPPSYGPVPLRVDSS
jgi:hypothetical protein